MKLHLAELRDRGVFQTLAGYAVVSWVLIEVTSVIAPAFLLPDWVVAALTTALVLGALPVLLLSWRYEFTLEGIKRDTRAVPDEFDRSARSVMTVIIVLLLAITTMLWVNYFRSQSKSEVEELFEAQQGAPEVALDGQIRSVAVLPFDDYSPGGGKGLLADGIAEAILHVLAQNRELVVTSRKSSFMFRDKAVSASEIGRILNVEALLEGSIQVVNDRLRVTSQLIRTSDQAHVWSNVYEAPLDDLFRINDEIGLEIRDLILPENRSLPALAGQPHPPSIPAFQLLLEARELIGDLESTERAIRMIRVILDMWPDYSEAWGWLAMAYDNKATLLEKSHTVSGTDLDAVWYQSMAAAETALDINPDNHLATLIIGRASADSTARGYHEAIEKVLDAAPNDPDVLRWIADLAIYSTNYQSAEEYLARARAVEPGDYDILESYLLSICGKQPQTPIVEKQLRDYPASRTRSLHFQGLAGFCDGHFIESATTAIRLARIDSDPGSVLHALMYLVDLGQHEALALVGAIHRLMPRFFNSSEEALNLLFYTDNIDERADSYHRHAGSDFRSSDMRIMYAISLLMKSDYAAAEQQLDRVRGFWDGFYASEGGRFWQSRTMFIYAYKAWFLSQRGEREEAGQIAAELLQALQDRGNLEWSGSRGLQLDIPLMILLLNGLDQQAVNWLLDAKHDQWLLFQAVVTSPVYAEFRNIPAVAEALSGMVEWRAGILDELIALDLPEVEDPSLLLELLQSLVTPTYHDRAQVALHFDDDPASAIKLYQRALENDPKNVAIISQLSSLTMEYGLLDEAVLLAERIVSLTPEDAGAHIDLAWKYACTHNYEGAVTSARRAYEIDPGNAYYQRLLAMALILNDEPEIALDVIQKTKHKFHRQLGLILAYYALGKQAESDALMEEWLENGAERTPQHFAYAAAFRNETDIAFEWLYQAAALGAANNVQVNPFFLNLYDDPRWPDFLESIGRSPGQLAEMKLKLTLPE